MIVYRGEYPAPEFEHGDTVMVSGLRGVIQHRRHTGYAWEYGVLLPGLGLCWYRFLKKEEPSETS